jgi:hypothetical protein
LWRNRRCPIRPFRSRSSTRHGIGYCNVTKCCSNVCPEEIAITDNAAIPLKERVIDQLYDPFAKLLRVFSNHRASPS